MSVSKNTIQKIGHLVRGLKNNTVFSKCARARSPFLRALIPLLRDLYTQYRMRVAKLRNHLNV